MRNTRLISMALIACVGLTACQMPGKKDEDPLKGVNVLEDEAISEMMLTVAQPREAVEYFKRAVAENPDNIDMKRSLASSLVRDKRIPEAVTVWREVIAHPETKSEDRVSLADALIRSGDWDSAEQMLNTVPPTHETFQRYKLEAMVADSKKDWKRADSFYEIAVGLTTKPASVLNNWGYSNLTRGNFVRAEQLFVQAIRNDPGLFTAKNNLVLARAAQRKYDLPVMEMTQTERAQLLHTAALSAIKQGDVATGKALLKEAINTHPQHFDAAVRALAALEQNVVN